MACEASTRLHPTGTSGGVEAGAEHLNVLTAAAAPPARTPVPANPIGHRAAHATPLSASASAPVRASSASRR
eukprot:3744524-Prymnesium_polylepis.1